MHGVLDAAEHERESNLGVARDRIDTGGGKAHRARDGAVDRVCIGFGDLSERRARVEVGERLTGVLAGNRAERQKSAP